MNTTQNEKEKIISETTECFDFDMSIIQDFSEEITSEILSVWNATHKYEAVYSVIQREIQLSSLDNVAKLLGMSPDELRSKYSYDILGQICGAYDMMSAVENEVYIIKELKEIMGAMNEFI